MTAHVATRRSISATGPMLVILLSVIGALTIYVLTGQTSEAVRTEAEQAVLLIDLESAIQDEISFARAYVAGLNGHAPTVAAEPVQPVEQPRATFQPEETTDDFPVHGDLDASITGGTLDHHPTVIEAMQRFDRSLGALRRHSPPSDTALIDAISQLHDRYAVALRVLDDAAHRGSDTSIVYEQQTNPIETDLRAAVDELRDRSQARLGSAIDRAQSSEYAFRFLLPAVLLAGAVAAIQLVRNRRAEQRVRTLEQLVGAKDEFIAAVSHELRTPLTGIVGFADLLREYGTAMPEDERNEILETIAEQGHEVGALVEDLLVAARMEIDQLTVRPEWLTLEQEAQRVATALGSDVVIELSDPALVEADGVRVRQIVRNLLTNAERYGTGPVQVRVGSDETVGWVRVGSTGDPIIEEDRDRIFEAYQRAHDHPGLAGSMGLGLAVSRRLARLMGGELRYVRDGDVNVFELTLPRREPDHRHSGDADQVEAARNAERKPSTVGRTEAAVAITSSAESD